MKIDNIYQRKTLDWHHSLSRVVVPATLHSNERQLWIENEIGMSAILLRQNSQIIRGEVIEVLKKRLVILLGLKLSYQ
jgi:hypothetical protein